MKPEVIERMARAVRYLDEAAVLVAAGLAESAGRNAYLAAFHASQAYIFEHTNNAPKTHRGTHAEFARLARDKAMDPVLKGFLGASYTLKTIADYGVSALPELTLAEAAEALARGRLFVAAVEKWIEDDSRSNKL